MKVHVLLITVLLGFGTLTAIPAASAECNTLGTCASLSFGCYAVSGHDCSWHASGSHASIGVTNGKLVFVGAFEVDAGTDLTCVGAGSCSTDAWGSAHACMTATAETSGLGATMAVSDSWCPAVGGLGLLP